MEAFEYDYSIFHDSYQLPLSEKDSRTKEQILLTATIHFAKNGYASVTMRDIARVTGIRQSSIYNHFESKEALWKAVLEHAKNLYMLYFNHLGNVIADAKSFEEVLGAIFHEPKQMRNAFTCYAFSMVQAEQFRDEDAENVFCDTFLGYSIDTIQKWFDQCVEKGMVRPFDTRTVATVIMHCTLVGIEMNVHERHDRHHPACDDSCAMLANLQRFILQTVVPSGAEPAGGLSS